MSQIRDPVNFPVLTQTSHRLSTMRLYRDWSVGRNSPARKPQGTDDDIDFLDEDFKNLALVVVTSRPVEALIAASIRLTTAWAPGAWRHNPAGRWNAERDTGYGRDDEVHCTANDSGAS